MVQAETAAWRNRPYFRYRNQERSNRTNGHLWEELVVETPDGSLSRLISEDGKPLSSNRQKEEDQRIAYLATHPSEFRRGTQRRQQDEARMPELLREVPNAFLFKTVRSVGAYTRIAFQPNPAFRERSYQDRVVHAMSGTLLIHTPDMRLSELDAHLDKTHFFLTRGEVAPAQWATTKIRVHLDGSILLLKSISRDLDASRYGFKPVAHGLSVAEAAAILHATTF
jgi:hypothetical protein